MLNQLEALGETQDKLALEGETVTLQQLRGIEINERAAALAELVLWIGWLQWHLRTRGPSSVAEPAIHDYGNIECRDAVLAYDRQEIAQGANGRPITRWDGRTFKTHTVTGEEVPDETAQVPQWKYVNARRAEWPEVEFIVGNPPFIGAGPMRAALGDGYVQTLRSTWPEVPESADFVMYWWNHAAALVREGRARRFGLITTNSLRQTFNRRVIEAHLSAKSPLLLAFAIPDHPWVDSAQGAAVRIAMSVGTAATGAGRLLTVVEERAGDAGDMEVRLKESSGPLHADLRLGANVSSAGGLRSNVRLANRGVQMLAPGFVVTPLEAQGLRAESIAKDFRNGRDLTGRPRGVVALDTFGFSDTRLRTELPAVFQWLLVRAKPARDQNPRESYRLGWWLFGENQPAMRSALTGLHRYVATAITARHRTFLFMEPDTLADQALLTIASTDALLLGVLSSQLHVDWALAAGGRLGVGNDPRYNKTRCFETFPFPSDDTGLTPELADRIRNLAEKLDAHRKSRQASHATVTLTGLYNVLDKLRRDEPLTANDKLLHEQGLVSVLRTLHDELDAAVLEAYGWRDLGPVPWADDAARSAWTEALLERLVALNAKRAAEEAQGTIRWLRPEFQNPAQATLFHF